MVGAAVVGAAVVGAFVVVVVGVEVGAAVVVAHVEANTTARLLMIDCTPLESVARVAVLLGTYSSCVPDTDDDVDNVDGTITFDAGEYTDDPTTKRMVDIAPVRVKLGESAQYPTVTLGHAKFLVSVSRLDARMPLSHTPVEPALFRDTTRLVHVFATIEEGKVTVNELTKY